MGSDRTSSASHLHTPAAYGSLPAGWSWSRLDEICEGIFDCPHSTPALVDKGPYVVRTQDITTGFFRLETAGRVSEETYTERVARAIPSYGDLLYSREGTYFGIAAEVPKNIRVCLGQRMVLLRPRPARLEFRFLRYWLNSPIMQRHIHGFRDGTVAERLNVPTIRALPIVVPPIAEQKTIADVLRTLDDKVEVNRRINETLETMVRTLFQSWFVDFDPVRAKMEGRVPAGMDATTASLFPDGLSNSEIGFAPRGWKFVALESLFSLDKGVSYKGSFLDDSGQPMINLGCFKGDGLFDPDRVKGYAGEVRDAHWVYPGDLLLANTDMTQNRIVLGSPAIVPRHLAQRYLFSHHVFAARFRRGSPSGLPLYCYYALLQPEFRTRVAGFATGTTVLALPRDAVLRLPVVLPPDGLIEAFWNFVAPLHALREQNDSESRKLCQMRDLILPHLLSGELRVRDAERVVEAAL